MNIALIGAGNVAWHLAQAFTKAGHKVVTVYSRTATQRDALLQLLPNARATEKTDFTNLAVDVVVLAVPDAAIAGVAAQLQVKPGTVVVHTSGSQPLALLQSIPGAKTGVFYPLQTFSKQKALDLKHVPFLVEAEEEVTLDQLTQLAQSISNQVQQVNSEARKQLHLAAVFACNFTNHLLGISHQLLQNAGLPHTLLQPLIQETIAKAALYPPFEVQTGPASRHDAATIQAHLQMLEQQPVFQELYLKLTQSIQAQSLAK